MLIKLKPGDDGSATAVFNIAVAPNSEGSFTWNAAARMSAAEIFAALVEDEPALREILTDHNADIGQEVKYDGETLAICVRFTPKAEGSHDAAAPARLPRDYVSSADICSKLAAQEDRPWAEFGRAGKPITPAQLARILARYGIKPHNIRMPDGRVVKGYHRQQFEDAWRRYTDVAA
jgi:hypothetical protein